MKRALAAELVGVGHIPKSHPEVRRSFCRQIHEYHCHIPIIHGLVLNREITIRLHP